MLDCIAGCHGFYFHARPILKVEGTACCPANVDHDAACNDDGGRISSVGKALDCRAEGPRLYSHAEPILRVEGNSCCPANVDHDAAYDDDDDDGLLPNVSTPLR